MKPNKEKAQAIQGVAKWLDEQGIAYTVPKKRRRGEPTFMIYPHGKHPLAMLMLLDGHSRITPMQRAFLDRLQIMGWVTLVSYGLEDAVKSIGRYV